MWLLATTGQDGVASLGDHVAAGSTEAELVSATVLIPFYLSSLFTFSIFAAYSEDA